MNAPIFIIGNPRSGTTLLRLMVTCHSRIVVPPECGWAVWLLPRYGDWAQGSDDAALATFVDDVVACKKFETWRMSVAELLDGLSARRPASYAEAVSAIYEVYGRRAKASFERWGDKNNFHLHHIGDLKELYPDAAFIHIVRDPRSLACSYRQVNAGAHDSQYAPKLPDDFGDIAREWSGNVETIRASFAAFDWAGVQEVRFEDLVGDPQAALSRLCQGLDEAFDPLMLEYHRVNRESALEPPEFMTWKAKTLEPPRKDRIDRFRQELTPEAIREIETVAQGPMSEYGYA